METISKKGLTAFQLKILALVFMTFDHIHYMFAGILDIPMWFTMIGRLAAPIFIFMVANGMHHTHSREKYVLRLYIGAVGMSMLNYILEIHFPHPTGAALMGNIFATMFLICLYIYIGGKIKENAGVKNAGKIVLFVLLGTIPLIGSIAFLPLVQCLPANLRWIAVVISSLLPSVLLVEGGFMFIILGIGFYLCGQKKWKQTIFYLVYCTVIFLFSVNFSNFGFEELFRINIQWMMVFALPFILLYNGQRGRGMKYLFYVYYPTHIYLLLFIARAIA